MIQLMKNIVTRNMSGRIHSALLLSALLLAVGVALTVSGSVADEARAMPAPALNEPTEQATSEIAVFAGGRFWGVQGLFQTEPIWCHSKTIGYE